MVKLNYPADKSFTFSGIAEMEHLPKPANTAYVIIDGNRDCTRTASNRSLERENPICTHSGWNPGIKCWHPKGMQVKRLQQMKICQSQAHFLLEIPYIPWLSPKATSSLAISACADVQKRNCTRAVVLSAGPLDRTRLQSEGKMKRSGRQVTHFQRQMTVTLSPF